MSDGFSPIRPNPYIVGTPVRERSMFFGREAEFELVRKRFADSTHGGLLVFCGERHSGKTSILFQILERRLGPDFIPVLIDMQSMAVSNEIDFLDKVSREVLEALGPGAAGVAPPEFREGSNHSATFSEFIERVLLAHPDKKLILLFDEYELFENKIDTGALNQDVLYVLANLIEQQPVFVVFTGSQHLEARRAEYWKILGKSIYKTISFLDRTDALSLIRRPVEGRLHYADGVVDRIVRLTAGQPFYTQAICQSLVDHANEAQSAVATLETLDGVVQHVVENPLPQMIFLWDGLERDEKLVLAVLAESLAEPGDWASVNHVARSIEKRDYPLELSRAQISTTLEKLFRSEMLLRNDDTDPPGYAFRMDLWRLWIRRQHSVWQVMREEGLEIPRGRPGAVRRAVFVTIGVVALALVVALLPAWRRSHGPLPSPPGLASPGPAGLYTLEVHPSEAVITRDDRRAGVGFIEDRSAGGTTHRFQVTAPGYADSEFTVSLAAGASQRDAVTLRPLLGDLAVSTTPPGADIQVNGRPQGKSPVVVRGLPVAQSAHVVASLPGYGAARGVFAVAPDRVTPATMTLAQGGVDLLVATDPPGAQIRVDGHARGVSPVRLSGLGFGSHAVTAARDGYVTAETTLIASEGTQRLDLDLRPAPPGVLVVLGDRPAQIYLNGSLIVENVQNSGPRELPPGSHQVHVVLVSGETIDQSVAVRSGERTTYDYSKNTVTQGSR